MAYTFRRPKIFDSMVNSIPSLSFDTNKISQIEYLLIFSIREDEALYKAHLAKMIHFPTFWPIIVTFILISIIHDNFVSAYDRKHALFQANFYISVINFFFMVLYTVALAIQHYSAECYDMFVSFARLVLDRWFFGSLDDVIIILVATCAGLHLLNVVNTYECPSCDSLFAVVCCDNAFASSPAYQRFMDHQEFPIGQIFFGYVSLKILPNYFKSMNRHIVLLSWAILTGFVIAAYSWKGFKLKPFTVLFIVFFFCALYENERDKMATYLSGKDALNKERHLLSLQVNQQKKDIERKLNLALVHQILPPKVAEQIIAGKQVAPEAFDEVTIFFSDVEGFTTICSQVTPDKVVNMLNDLYTVMDYCTSKFPLYKVETIGDAYMLVGGLPVKDSNHALQIADFALHVQTAVNSVLSPVDGKPIRIRIGIHSGPVMAGVVGNLMPRYCLFGDTVNTASRMESNGLAGQIHCSERTAQILMAKGRHVVTKRGEMEIKGKGLMTTYWLQGATPNNDNSNAAAIGKMQIMIHDILNATHDEINHIPTNNKDDGFFSPASSQRRQSVAGQSPSPTRHTGGLHVNTASVPGTPEVMLSPMNNHNNNNSSSNHGSGHTPGGGGAAGSSEARGGAGSRYAVDQHTMIGGLSSEDEHYVKDVSSGAKVLVVEDSTSQRKMLVQRLKKADESWDVSAAANGEDAVQMLKAARFKFDVVFVDENLSTADGLFGHELVSVMRTQYNMQSCVIIACTSNPASAGPALLAAGVDFVWPKPPPDSKTIKNKIDDLLNMRLRENQLINLE